MLLKSLRFINIVMIVWDRGTLMDGLACGWPGDVACLVTATPNMVKNLSAGSLACWGTFVLILLGTHSTVQ